MSKPIMIVFVLLFGTSHAVATSCHDLQRAQLMSLNERMTQMIDSISSLLPKTLNKPTPPVTLAPTPPADYITSSSGYETSHYSVPPTYAAAPPTSQLMYTSPSYVPMPASVIFTPPVQQTPTSSLRYPQMGTGSQTDYPLSTLTNLAPQLPQPQYEQYLTTTLTNPASISNLPSTSYLFHPYSLSQPQHTTEYIIPYSSQLSGQPPYSFPVYMPSRSYAPGYP